ncbi:MAG: ATP-binding protein [Candidatus Syntropharchaeia archaeon]
MLKREHPSKLRNRLIAFVFYYAGLIEKWGTGTIRMITQCRKHGLPDPEFSEEFDGFSVRFRKDIYSEESLRKMGLNERQIKAVLYIKKKGKITNREYQEINGVSKSTATRELTDLVNKGIFERVGSGKRDVYYKLMSQK